MGRWRAVLKKLLSPDWGRVAPAAVLGGATLAATFLVEDAKARLVAEQKAREEAGKAAAEARRHPHKP